MNTVALVLLFACAIWIIRAQRQLKRKADRIIMNQAELAAHLTAVDDQLDKATAEILAAIQALKDALANVQTTPEVDAAVARLDTAAQTLDDINPDPGPGTPKAA
jgi:ABC-type transporter Mla subunit MlaD